MMYVVEKCFIVLFCTFAQVYDRSVGNPIIPKIYEGFDQSTFENSPHQTLSEPPIYIEPCGDFPDPTDPACPIDDYVYLLIALCLGYGFLKFRKQKHAA